MTSANLRDFWTPSLFVTVPLTQPVSTIVCPPPQCGRTSYVNGPRRRSVGRIDGFSDTASTALRTRTGAGGMAQKSAAHGGGSA